MTEPIRTGKPDVRPDAPTHTKGTSSGNQPGSYRKQRGHKRDGTSGARRSTGIRPRARKPIVRGAPDISPA